MVNILVCLTQSGRVVSHYLYHIPLGIFHCVLFIHHDIAYKKFQIYLIIMAGIILITLDNPSIEI